MIRAQSSNPRSFGGVGEQADWSLVYSYGVYERLVSTKLFRLALVAVRIRGQGYQLEIDSGKACAVCFHTSITTADLRLQIPDGVEVVTYLRRGA